MARVESVASFAGAAVGHENVGRGLSTPSAPDRGAKPATCDATKIDLAHALDIDRPSVALLSAAETVNPKITSTLDAAALCKMTDRGQITGAVLDGPRLPSSGKVARGRAAAG